MPPPLAAPPWCFNLHLSIFQTTSKLNISSACWVAASTCSPPSLVLQFTLDTGHLHPLRRFHGALNLRKKKRAQTIWAFGPFATRKKTAELGVVSSGRGAHWRKCCMKASMGTQCQRKAWGRAKGRQAWGPSAKGRAGGRGLHMCMHGH